MLTKFSWLILSCALFLALKALDALDDGWLVALFPDSRLLRIFLSRMPFSRSICMERSFENDMLIFRCLVMVEPLKQKQNIKMGI